MEVLKTDEFDRWFKKLRDSKAKAVIGLRINRIINTGNLGDYKVIDGHIKEMRINSGPGYRIYFTQKRGKIVLLLNGGNKSSQNRDIEKAKKLNEKYETAGYTDEESK